MAVPRGPTNGLCAKIRSGRRRRPAAASARERNAQEMGNPRAY
jgi:hypothetical protein